VIKKTPGLPVVGIFMSGGAMQISIIHEREVWDRFIDQSPGGTIFHKWDFLKTVEKHLGYKLLPYGFYVTDEILCAIPLFYKNIRGVKMLFSPPPQCGIPYLGFVLSRNCTNMKLSKKSQRMYEMGKVFSDEVDSLSPNYVSISLTPFITDVRPFKWNGFLTDPLYTFYFDLERSLEDICNGFNTSKRTAVKKMDKYNMKLVESKDIKQFYNSSVDRYREQGLTFPIVSVAYLEELCSLYPSHIKVYSITDADDNMVGGVLASEHRKVIMWMGSVKPSVKAPVNEFLFWEFIKKSKSEGYQELEMGGADIPRLCAFKSQFNPDMYVNYRIYKKDLIGSMAEWFYLNVHRKKTA
jgi:hypothetical protein